MKTDPYRTAYPIEKAIVVKDKRMSPITKSVAINSIAGLAGVVLLSTCLYFALGWEVIAHSFLWAYMVIKYCLTFIGIGAGAIITYIAGRNISRAKKRLPMLLPKNHPHLQHHTRPVGKELWGNRSGRYDHKSKFHKRDCICYVCEVMRDDDVAFYEEEEDNNA